MLTYRLLSLDTLFDELWRWCSPSTPRHVASTFLASELRDIAPTPSNPDTGISLGSPAADTGSVASADPPSRRGVRQKRKADDKKNVKAKRKKVDSEEETTMVDDTNEDTFH